MSNPPGNHFSSQQRHPTSSINTGTITSRNGPANYNPGPQSFSTTHQSSSPHGWPMASPSQNSMHNGPGGFYSAPASHLQHGPMNHNFGSEGGQVHQEAQPRNALHGHLDSPHQPQLDSFSRGTEMLMSQNFSKVGQGRQVRTSSRFFGEGRVRVMTDDLQCTLATKQDNGHVDAVWPGWQDHHLSSDSPERAERAEWCYDRVQEFVDDLVNSASTKIIIHQAFCEVSDSNSKSADPRASSSRIIRIDNPDGSGYGPIGSFIEPARWNVKAIESGPASNAVKFTRGVGDTCRVVEVPRNEKDPNYSAVCTQVATLDSGRGSDEFRDLRTQASSIDSGVLLANQMEMEVNWKNKSIDLLDMVDTSSGNSSASELGSPTSLESPAGGLKKSGKLVTVSPTMNKASSYTKPDVHYSEQCTQFTLAADASWEEDLVNTGLEGDNFGYWSDHMRQPTQNDAQRMAAEAVVAERDFLKEKMAEMWTMHSATLADMAYLQKKVVDMEAQIQSCSNQIFTMRKNERCLLAENEDLRRGIAEKDEQMATVIMMGKEKFWEYEQRLRAAELDTEKLRSGFIEPFTRIEKANALKEENLALSKQVTALKAKLAFSEPARKIEDLAERSETTENVPLTLQQVEKVGADKQTPETEIGEIIVKHERQVELILCDKESEKRGHDLSAAPAFGPNEVDYNVVNVVAEQGPVPTAPLIASSQDVTGTLSGGSQGEIRHAPGSVVEVAAPVRRKRQLRRGCCVVM